MTSLAISRQSGSADAFASSRATRRFHLGLAIAVLATVFSGFGISVHSRLASGPLPIRAAVHGTLFLSWVVLFAVQISLVAARRIRVHRALGTGAGVLALIMVLSAPPLAIQAAREGVLPGNSLEFLLVMFVDLLLFGVFVSAAIIYRRRPELHKRLMVLGMISMLPPAISRWPIAIRHGAIIPAVLLLFLLATPAFDYLARRRQHPVTVWGGLVVVLSLPIRFAIAHTLAWHAVASWLVR
jgi:hypothetical protein